MEWVLVLNYFAVCHALTLGHLDLRTSDRCVANRLELHFQVGHMFS